MKNMWSYSSVQEQKKSVLKQSLKAQCMLGIGLSPIKKIFPVQQQQLMSTDTAGYSTAYLLRFPETIQPHGNTDHLRQDEALSLLSKSTGLQPPTSQCIYSNHYFSQF